jgi:hypothetical protein
MNGRPVWLASISMRDSLGQVIPTGRWSERQREKADRIIERVLHGVGDESREVAFRMNVTVCRHRGLTDTEEAGLPGSFHEYKATDSAGASIELLWARGVSGAAIEPCANPGREPIADAGGVSTDPELWLPIPCGRCEPCRAREALVA